MGTPKFALIALGFLTVVSVAALVALFIGADPTYADRGTFVAFYTSVFLSATGLTAFLFMTIRAKVPKTKRPLRLFFTDALRQSILVAGIVTVTLMLQAERQLSFVWILLLVAFAVGVEAYWTRTRRTHG